MTSFHDDSATPLHLALGDAVRRRGDQFELVDRGLADAVDLAQPRFRRMDHFGERAEFLEQRLGERLCVAPGQRGKQRHLQQLVIAQRVRPGDVKALAQPLAMAVIMRRLGGLVLAVSLVLAGIGAQPCRAHKFLQERTAIGRHSPQGVRLRPGMSAASRPRTGRSHGGAPPGRPPGRGPRGLWACTCARRSTPKVRVAT